jgi:chromosomal replication initiation ATPase DnaA
MALRTPVTLCYTPALYPVQADVQPIIKRTKAETIDCIKNAVLTHYDVTWEQIDKRTRKKEFITPRHMIMYLLYVHAGLSFDRIGRMFKEQYDHSTVINAKRTVTDLIDTGYLSSDYQIITSKILTTPALDTGINNG